MNMQHDAADERFHPCPAGRHWGPRGAAGILPYAVARDGQAWVLLSHRSPHVQRGGTWSTFGGAIDAGESAWRAAVRETREEIRGITPDQAGIVGECVRMAVPPGMRVDLHDVRGARPAAPRRVPAAGPRGPWSRRVGDG